MDSVISIPLSIFRKWLYIIVIIFPLVFVLLPFSIISYINFYNVIIPSSFTSSPVKFKPSVDYMTTYIDFDSLPVKFDDSSNYVLQLDLWVVCEKSMNDVVPIEYTIDELNINENFILNCEHRYVYGKNNWFVPYNFRLWVPPLFTSLERVNHVPVYLTVVSGHELNDVKTMNIKLKDQLTIDHRISKLNTIIQWDGFRYYMVNYYIICFIIGVGIFWSISSFVCLITSFLIWMTYSNKKSKFD